MYNDNVVFLTSFVIVSIAIFLTGILWQVEGKKPSVRILKIACPIVFIFASFALFMTREKTGNGMPTPESALPANTTWEVLGAPHQSNGYFLGVIKNLATGNELALKSKREPPPKFLVSQTGWLPFFKAKILVPLEEK